MSAIQPEAAMLRGAVALDGLAQTGRVGPRVGRIMAAFALAVLGLCLGLIAGAVLALASGLVALC